ncbi:hypothetical protein HK102_000306 [Quaeritorhiza haematococci]|nr:hypothetical protein HK102_000306 [Quaeritorhiza haematococci]
MSNIFDVAVQCRGVACPATDGITYCYGVLILRNFGTEPVSLGSTQYSLSIGVVAGDPNTYRLTPGANTLVPVLHACDACGIGFSIAQPGGSSAVGVSFDGVPGSVCGSGSQPVCGSDRCQVFMALNGLVFAGTTGAPDAGTSIARNPGNSTTTSPDTSPAPLPQNNGAASGGTFQQPQPTQASTQPTQPNGSWAPAASPSSVVDGSSQSSAGVGTVLEKDGGASSETTINGNMTPRGKGTGGASSGSNSTVPASSSGSGEDGPSSSMVGLIIGLITLALCLNVVAWYLWNNRRKRLKRLKSRVAAGAYSGKGGRDEKGGFYSTASGWDAKGSPHARGVEPSSAKISMSSVEATSSQPTSAMHAGTYESTVQLSPSSTAQLSPSSTVQSAGSETRVMAPTFADPSRPTATHLQSPPPPMMHYSPELLNPFSSTQTTWGMLSPQRVDVNRSPSPQPLNPSEVVDSRHLPAPPNQLNIGPSPSPHSVNIPPVAAHVGETRNLTAPSIPFNVVRSPSPMSESFLDRTLETTPPPSRFDSVPPRLAKQPSRSRLGETIPPPPLSNASTNPFQNSVHNSQLQSPVAIASPASPHRPIHASRLPVSPATALPYMHTITNLAPAPPKATPTVPTPTPTPHLETHTTHEPIFTIGPSSATPTESSTLPFNYGVADLLNRTMTVASGTTLPPYSSPFASVARRMRTEGLLEEDEGGSSGARIEEDGDEEDKGAGLGIQTIMEVEAVREGMGPPSYRTNPWMVTGARRL